MHLLALPDEVLDHILSFLRFIEHQDRRRYRPYFSYLYRVMLTCKRLRNLAIPRLYEIISTEYRLVELIKSLALYPANASLVRQVDLAWQWSQFNKIPLTPEDMNLFNGILESHGISRQRSSADAAVRLGTGICSFPTDTLDWTRLRDEHQAAHYRLLAAVVILLAPNARIISYELDVGSPIAFPSKSLRQLRCLSIYNWNVKYGYDLTEISNLLNAAPNIDHLSVSNVTTVTSLPRNENMTKLSLSSSHLMRECWDVVFTAFPNLERLLYRDCGTNYDDQLLPRQLYDALVKHRPKLKHPHLSLEELALDNFVNHSSDHEFIDNHLMKSLTFMDDLETIHISAGHLFREYCDDYSADQSHPYQMPGTLVDFLPKSVQRLAISNLVDVAKDDILQLIKVAHERFPNLKAIDISEASPPIVHLLENVPRRHMEVNVFKDNSDLPIHEMYDCALWLQPLDCHWRPMLA